MDAGAVTEAMLGKLTDPEHRSGPMLALFRALTVPALARLLADKSVRGGPDAGLHAGDAGRDRRRLGQARRHRRAVAGHAGGAGAAVRRAGAGGDGARRAEGLPDREGEGLPAAGGAGAGARRPRGADRQPEGGGGGRGPRAAARRGEGADPRRHRGAAVGADAAGAARRRGAGRDRGRDRAARERRRRGVPAAVGGGGGVRAVRSEEAFRRRGEYCSGSASMACATAARPRAGDDLAWPRGARRGGAA